MSENELVDAIEAKNVAYAIEEADEGDDGFYAYVDGWYLPNCYPSEHAALEAIAESLGVNA